jgi:ABC-2 type transport system ATP-binding protein
VIDPVGDAVSDEPAIVARGLRRSYGDIHALHGIDLHVDRGEVFALLGPNGAGKTTATEILEGFRSRTGGEVAVLGVDPAVAAPSMRERIGVVLQSSGGDPYLTAAETVAMFAGCFRRSRPVGEVLDLVGLADRAAVRVGKLSGGQRRRLDVAVALVGDPELLFLDEPTTGFDPSARRNAWSLVRELAALGKTIFLTTHFMDEAQALADRVAVIVDGEIVAEGPPSTLGGRTPGGARIRFRLPPVAPAPPDLGQVRLPDGSWEVTTDDATSTTHVLTGWALEAGIRLARLEVAPASLEDVYLELTDGGSDA